MVNIISNEKFISKTKSQIFLGKEESLPSSSAEQADRVGGKQSQQKIDG